MFKLRIQSAGNWEVVTLNGDLDQSAIDDFKQGMEALLAGSHKQYLFDLSSLKFISSEGLNILLWFRFQVEKFGAARIVLTNVSPFIQKLFNITKLDSHFEIQPDKDQFLAGISENGKKSPDTGQS